MSIFKTIWDDTVKFIESICSWIAEEAEDFWHDGGSVVFNTVMSLGESAFSAWVASTPASSIFSDFESFAISYIKANWKTDLGLLEDAVVNFVTGSIGIKYQIPTTTTANNGVLEGGVQQGS